MISAVRLTNFQCHSDLLVELDEHVTVIIGPSDSGKSAVIRALRWAALNVPVGCMIRDGAKQAKVELTVDGRKIVRSRGSENAYSLDGKEFRAFRSDVPSDIATLLNLTDANFQSQHDPLYWFSSTAGDVSRQLNAVVNLNVIDRTLSEATREVNRCKTILENAEENLTRSVAEKDDLQWVEEADVDLKQVEGLEKSLDELKRRSSILAEVTKTAIAKSDGVVLTKGIAVDSETMLGKMIVLGKAAKARTELDKLIVSAIEARVKKDIEIPDLSVLGTIVELLKDRAARTKELSKLLNEVWLADENRGTTKMQSDKAQDELARKSEGICPLCGGKI